MSELDKVLDIRCLDSAPVPKDLQDTPLREYSWHAPKFTLEVRTQRDHLPVLSVHL